MSAPGWICEACGYVQRKCPRNSSKVEQAHIFAGGVHGVNGCRCPVNIMKLCWPCHRMVQHVKGWAELLKLHPSLGPRVDLAQEHSWARNRGETKCARGKVAAIARARIVAAKLCDECKGTGLYRGHGTRKVNEFTDADEQPCTECSGTGGQGR